MDFKFTQTLLHNPNLYVNHHLLQYQSAKQHSFLNQHPFLQKPKFDLGIKYSIKIFLQSRYNQSENNYYLRYINAILSKDSTPSFIKIKDYILYDQGTEMLKKVYSFTKSIQIISIQSSEIPLYKNHFFFKDLGEIYNQYFSAKQKLLKQRQQFQKRKSTKIEKNVSIEMDNIDNIIEDQCQKEENKKSELILLSQASMQSNKNNSQTLKKILENLNQNQGGTKQDIKELENELYPNNLQINLDKLGFSDDGSQSDKQEQNIYEIDEIIEADKQKQSIADTNVRVYSPNNQMYLSNKLAGNYQKMDKQVEIKKFTIQKSVNQKDFIPKFKLINKITSEKEQSPKSTLQNLQFQPESLTQRQTAQQNFIIRQSASMKMINHKQQNNVDDNIQQPLKFTLKDFQPKKQEKKIVFNEFCHRIENFINQQQQQVISKQETIQIQSGYNTPRTKLSFGKIQINDPLSQCGTPLNSTRNSTSRNGDKFQVKPSLFKRYNNDG